MKFSLSPDPVLVFLGEYLNESTSVGEYLTEKVVIKTKWRKKISKT